MGDGFFVGKKVGKVEKSGFFDGFGAKNGYF